MRSPASMLFDGLPGEALQLILKQPRRYEFPRGTPVIAEGERLHELFLVEAGTAEVTVVDRMGAVHQVNVVGPGDVLGEMSLFTGRPASATVRATEDLSVIVLTEGEFRAVGDAFPRLYQNLGSIVSRKLYHADRLHLDAPPASVVSLTGTDAEPLGGYALACSLAWHIRAPVLLVAHGGAAQSALAPFITQAEAQYGWLSEPVRGPPRPRAYIVFTSDTGPFAPEHLSRTLERLTDAFQYILVQGTILPRSATRSVPALSQFGWLDGVPLRTGLLPPTNVAGREVGRIARAIAGLRVGVALGAGGMKGFAHIGVLSALEKAGIPIDFVAGCSVGALVAALYASGHHPDRIAELLEHGGTTGIRPVLSIRSVFSDAPLRRFGREVIGPGHIEDLSPSVAIVAADILTGEEIVFRRGPVWPAVLASCAIPGVLPAQRIGNRVLVDGGIVDPVPDRVVTEMGADVVLAVNLRSARSGRRSEASASEPHGRAPALVEVITRAIDIMQSRVAPSESAASITIAPDCAGAVAWDLRRFARGVAYVASGEAAVQEVLPRIAAALPWVRS